MTAPGTPAGAGVGDQPTEPEPERPDTGPERRSTPALLDLRIPRPTIFSSAVLLTVAWGVLANLGRIGFPVTGFDEPLYAFAGWRYVHGQTGAPPAAPVSNFDNLEHPPLAKYLFGLAELVAGHPSITAARVVAALCTLATAVVLGVWLGRRIGRWAGLGAAAMVAVLPMSVPDVPFRFGRYAYLDPVAELFAVSAVVLAWSWFDRPARGGWRFALATGACIGLASASKETGFLGAAGPVLVGLTSALLARRERVLRVLQVVAAAAVSVAVFAATFLGLSHPWASFRFMLHFQHLHSELGHRVQFAGRTSIHPPAWAFLWFAQHGLGPVVAVACLVCFLAAVVLRPDRLTLWCVAALIGPLVFHMAIAGVILGFYWVMWMPFFLALVARGVAELVAYARRPAARGRLVGGLAGAGAVLVLLGASARDTYRMTTRTPPDRTPYSHAVLRRSPLLYARLDEKTGTLAADSSGHGRLGVYVGYPSLGAAALVDREAGSAVTFHGFPQFVRVPGAAWMDVPDYAVALWFRSTAAGRYLVSRDDYATKVWNLQLDDGGHLRFVTYAAFGGGGQVVDSPGTYADGRPHFAVAVKDGDTTRLFVDGREVASAGWQDFARSATVDLDLGRRGNNHGYFAGTLDDVAFFDTPLSAADVRTLYRDGRRRPR